MATAACQGVAANLAPPLPAQGARPRTVQGGGANERCWRCAQVNHNRRGAAHHAPACAPAAHMHAYSLQSRYDSSPRMLDVVSRGRTRASTASLSSHSSREHGTYTRRSAAQARAHSSSQDPNSPYASWVLVRRHAQCSRSFRRLCSARRSGSWHAGTSVAASLPPRQR